MAEGPITSPEILSEALFIDQIGTADSSNSIKSDNCLPSIAIVDRTADVPKAARQILSAYVAFSGQSPHSPSLVIVNEWVKKELLDTFSREMIRSHRETRSSFVDDPEWKTAVDHAKTKGNASIIDHDLCIIDVYDR